MPRFAGPPLGLVVALTGLAVLGAEIATARLLAPAFGSSTVIWATTIGIVLVALAIGAWFGGRLADAGPTARGMHQLLLAGSALVAVIPIAAAPLLSAGVGALDDINAPIFFGALLSVVVLVSIPLTLLGAVSPYTMRLALDEVARSSDDAGAIGRAGRVAGRLSALGTAGSLAGTFLSALVLIPLLGTRRTFFLMALVLALLAAWGLLATAAHANDEASDAPAEGRRLGHARIDRTPIGGGWRAASAIVPLAIAALLVLPAPTIKAAGPGLRLLEERETGEQYARVLENAAGVRTMELGEGQAIHSLRRPGSVLTGGYWDELLVLPQLRGGDPRRVLILGNAGGTTATALRALNPKVEVDAVDYDGQLTELGRRWFGLGGPRLRLMTGDARVELRRSPGGYDAILVDAYRQPYIPFHLSTREFFALAKARLAPGGVVIVNVGHPSGSTELEQVLTASMRAGGLRHIARDPAQRLNTQLVGRAEPIEVAPLLDHARTLQRGPSSDHQALAETARQTALRLVPGLPGSTVFTDDRAPVELLIDGSLAEVATGG